MPEEISQGSLGEGSMMHPEIKGVEQKSLVTVSFSWQCIALLLFFHDCTRLAHLKRVGRKDMVKSLHKQLGTWELFAEISPHGHASLVQT